MKKAEEIQQIKVENQWLKAELGNEKFKYVRQYLKEFYRAVGSNYFQLRTFENFHAPVILRMERGKLLSQLPKDIKWFEASLSVPEFAKVQVICESSWHQEFVKEHKCCTVEQIARRVLFTINNHKNLLGPRLSKKTIAHFLRDSPHAAKVVEIFMHGEKHDFNEKLILLKSSGSPVISILEGNHRAIAFYMWYLTKKRKPPTDFLVGISPQMQLYPWYNYKKHLKTKNDTTNS